VIPTVAGWTHLETALPALLAAMSPLDEAVVVGDGRDPMVPPLGDPRCRIVVHRGRSGFAPVCNRGADESRGDLLLFLNDDVTVSTGVLEVLETALRAPGVGAVGPDVVSEALGRSESGTTLAWNHGVLEARQLALAGAGDVAVPYLCGAALAMRRLDFLRIGGFDERLAPYFWEDVDLSLRVRERVGATVVASGATVVHRHGASVGREPGAKRRIVYERNRLLVSWGHLHGGRWLAHLAWLPLRLAAGAIRGRAATFGFPLALFRLLAGGRVRARRG
jgi:GT2 family glycosyltransferase